MVSLFYRNGANLIQIQQVRETMFLVLRHIEKFRVRFTINTEMTQCRMCESAAFEYLDVSKG